MKIGSVVRSTVALTITAILTSGCSLITRGDCVDIGVSGIQVTVLDQRTRQSPSGAIVTLTDGDYRETLIGRGGVYSGAIERPGTYSITVEAPGYARWTRDNVSVVRSGSCNYLKNVALTSDLQPIG
ncbi:carboxypeptidase-like regulatory domain-containing protein [Gemmatimonas sp. TET16]|uniref:Carboxypeptidase regulatory-like domain-containing protein n=1 Tax=Gemmatimonas groenlandica TaxID=2732249 RepID=A0A6M4IY54_9BACT|nr:carboxypeptidase regulatory-like domain-containing protein [Gemmatimonas groenlandica]